MTSQGGNSATRSDRLSLSYTIWTFCLFVLLASFHELDRIFNLYLFLIPILVLPTVVVAVTLLIALIVNLMKRRWRLVLSVVLAPALAAAALLALMWLGVTPFRVLFEIKRFSFEREIAQTPEAAGAPRLRSFEWGDTGGAGVANIFETIIYDESDEIALPALQRSEAWLARAKATGPSTGLTAVLKMRHTEESSVSVEKIRGHYYLVTEVYQ